jgi:hypothetical protein
MIRITWVASQRAEFGHLKIASLFDYPIADLGRQQIEIAPNV